MCGKTERRVCVCVCVRDGQTKRESEVPGSVDFIQVFLGKTGLLRKPIVVLNGCEQHLGCESVGK